MRAVRIHNYGSTEDLRVDQVQKPAFSETEILVKVHAASVNHIDALKASGVIKHIYPLELPWTPGSDFSGVIAAVGDKVTDFVPGDEVYGSNTNGGAYAEYIVVSADMIAKKPATLTFEEAASVPMAAETANQGLFKYANLKAGQSILIHGAAGAVGAYAVQFAHQAGAEVIVTSSSRDKEYLESIGADRVLDYTSTKFESAIDKVDIVFDLVGGDVQQRSFSVVKRGGLLLAANQPPSQEEAGKHEISAVFMHAKPTNEGLTLIAALIDSGKLKTDVAHVYPLEDTAQAWINVSTNLAANKSSVTSNIIRKHGKHVLKVLS